MKKMNESLRLNFKLLDLVYDSVTIFDPQGKVVYANKSAAESRGYTIDEFLELHINELYPKDRVDYVKEKLSEAIKEGEVIFEVENITKNGELKWFKVKAIPVRIDGQVYFLKIGMNIKEKYDRIMTEVQAIERSQKLLEGASRVTSMVRHDLRSPLQSIKNAVHIIRRSPEKTEDMLDVIDKAADYASKILNDLKFITNPGILQRERFDIVDLLEERIKSMVKPSSIHVETDFPESLIVNMDSTMISRVIDNLIRNAVEAMQDGGKLTLSLDVRDGMMNLLVADTGVGISGDNKQNIFQPFYTTKSSGTGLGLYYSKLAVQSHGGKIYFKSEKGEGTSFLVTLPLER